MKSARTKATDIPKKVKDIVYERDGGRCVICGSYLGQPNAHVIPRSLGGMGVPKNIVTLCPVCHYTYDETAKRSIYRAQIETYLKGIYKDWNEEDMIYKSKWEET